MSTARLSSARLRRPRAWVPALAFCVLGLVACNTEESVVTGVSELTSTTAEWRPPGERTIPDETTPEGTTAEARTTSTTIPDSAIVVSPDEAIGEVVESSPEGAIFWLEEGIHRLAVINPKNGQSFLGAPGATLRGSMVLDDFVAED